MPNKFNRAARAVPNEYIVALNDDTTKANAPSIINTLANAYGGTIKHNWGDTLKGFSVRMPEAEAIALSNDPHVKYVVENGYATALQTPLTPWALVRMSHEGPVGSITDDGFALNGTFTAPNDGSGVNVYVIDTGIRITHHQFGNRASVAADTTGGNGIDCNGHGTEMASMIGGHSSVSGEPSLGVATGVTLYSVRSNVGPPPCGGVGNDAELINGINWVAQNAIKPAVGNMSFEANTNPNPMYNQAADSASANGVTMVAAAGNDSSELGTDTNAGQRPAAPAVAQTVITAGGSNSGEAMYASSNYGARIDVFAPGSRVPGAAIVDANGQPSDSAITPAPAVAGTSASAAYVSGVAAVYLHDHPSGTASLPKIVKQVIMGNANICTHESIDDHTCTKVNNRHPEVGTADRLLFSSLMPVPANPIDNQRFFVWQHDVDFLRGYPNETGLDFWTRNIAGGNTINGGLVGGCGLNRFDVNVNNPPCTHDWRINTSLAFWVDVHPELFTTSYGLTSGNNSQFVKLCYSIYLKFNDADQMDPSGFGYWKGVLDSYGDPASPTGVRVLIDSFLNSTGPGIPPGPPGYRVLFGAS